MRAVFRYQDRCYEDQSIYVTGRTYVNCTFRRCTLIVRELPFAGAFSGCEFDSCVWHFSIMVSDRRAWGRFLTDEGPSVTSSLPAVPEALGESRQHE